MKLELGYRVIFRRNGRLDANVYRTPTGPLVGRIEYVPEWLDEHNGATMKAFMDSEADKYPNLAAMRVSSWPHVFDIVRV